MECGYRQGVRRDGRRSRTNRRTLEGDQLSEGLLPRIRHLPDGKKADQANGHQPKATLGALSTGTCEVRVQVGGGPKAHRVRVGSHICRFTSAHDPFGDLRERVFLLVRAWNSLLLQATSVPLPLYEWPLEIHPGMGHK